jgi:hypothetical protein
LAKQFRKERRALLREMEGPKLKAMKKGILTDLAIISLAFLLLFTGFNGLYTLQTTVNDQLGTVAVQKKAMINRAFDWWPLKIPH